MPLLIALSLIILVILLARRGRKGTAGPKLRRPPGPPGLPFFGNLLQFNPSDLHLRLEKLSNKYGPLMSMTLVGKPVIVISSARVAKEALKHNDLAFSSRPSFICSRKLSYDNHDIAFSPYTEYWREMRKMVVLRLFTLKQVNSFGPAREDEVARMVQQISRRANAQQPVNINETALTLSSNMISRFALGKRYDEEGRSGKRFFDLFQQELTLQIFIGDYFPWLGWIDKLCGRVSRLEKAFKDLDSFYEELIEEHLSPNRPDSMNGDILDLLIQLKEDRSSPIQINWNHVKGVLMDIFVAGTDTTAAAITWAMTALIKKPQVLNKVQQEIRTLVGKKGLRVSSIWVGRRVCPGMALGTAELNVVLANLLYSFNWELPPGMVEDDVDMDSLPGLVTHRKNPLCLMAKSYV
ncbi:UNVERIFIED_CONTAM: cytochrome [Sesamum calycinum]|uniref:Cytochrome n=1 Tax=Sesamum calycinum TaxID=2727403 RepID=A0AAW2R9D9_9LAMI